MIQKDKEYYIGIDWGRINGRYTEDLAGHSLLRTHLESELLINCNMMFLSVFQ